jgi:hypothetical protein
MAEKLKEVKKVTAGLIFSWIFGVLFLFGGLGMITSGAFLMGILVMICSLLIIPATKKFTSEKLHFEISGGVKWILVILVFVFFGIGISQTDDSSPFGDTSPAQNTAINQPTKTASTPTAKTYGIGDSLVAGDFTWKITGVTTASQIGENLAGTFFGEKASGIFVILSVEVENTGKTADYLSDSYIKLVDDQGREFSASTMAAIYLKPDGSALMFEQVNPGIVKKGKIVYDVPTGLKVANVKITSSLFNSEYYTVKIDIP